MNYEVNTLQLARDIRTKRTIENDIDLRKLAGETGVSFGTISRLENKRIPDIITLFKMCKWLGKPMDSYIKKVK